MLRKRDSARAGLVALSACALLVTACDRAPAVPDPLNETPARAAGGLTPGDEVELRQLVARYAYALDERAPEAFAELFTADGTFSTPDNGRIEGADQLAAFVRARPAPTYPAHFTTNHVLAVSPEGVTGRQYVIVLDVRDERPGGEFTTVGGHYEDLYARTPEGWRFERRQFFPSQPGPQPATAAAGTAAPGELAADAAPPAGDPSLSPMDYVEIEQLAIRYAYALDTGADEGRMYASVFTPDAEFIGRQVPLTQGHERLAAVARSVRRANRAYVRHFITNHVIEPSPEGATGQVYLAVVDIAEDGNPGGSIYLGGRYEDVYVRTPEGWRIARRDARAMGPARFAGLR